MLICVVACVGITIGSERNAKEVIWGQSAQFESKIGEIAREKIHERKREMIATETKEEWREIISKSGRSIEERIQNRSVQFESEFEENTREENYERAEVVPPTRERAGQRGEKAKELEGNGGKEFGTKERQGREPEEPGPAE